MNTTPKQKAAIFNEWARCYAEDPESFTDILDADGKPFEDYGDQCAAYFDSIAAEMREAGTLPADSE